MNSIKEIKQILLGRIEMDEDGNLTPISSGINLNLRGLPEGWGSVMIFGVSQSYHMYDTELSPEEAAYEANESLKDIGRCVVLKENSEAIGCYCRSLFLAPSFVAAEWEDDRLKITVFTGRSVFSPLTRFIMHSKYKRYLGDNFVRMDRNKENEKKMEEKREKRELKRQEKENKKSKKKKKADR